MPPQVDLSKISTEDLEALQAGDLSKVSTPTLELLQGAGTPTSPPSPAPPPQKSKWFGKPEVPQGDILNLSPLQAGPEMFNRGMDYVGATIGNQLKKLPGPSDTVKDYWTKKVKDLANTPQGKWAIDAFQRGGGVWDSFQRSYPEQAEAVKRATEFGVNLATLAVGRPGAKTTAGLGEKLPMPNMGRLSTQPTKDEALGQILQGKTKDLAKGETAFGVIDTAGVKTYTDLSERISKAIPEYAKKVDAELAKDPNKYTLDWLATTSKTKAGTPVKQNYVEMALKHLQELYEKTSDPVKAKEIEETIMRARSEGLTRVDVNNIARQYGSEFGDKAFSKATQEPLTSVNAQAFENVRKGVKNTAREGMSGEAKEGDRVLSSLMNTKELIAKNMEAVRKLKQKVDERGLGEKLGRGFLTIMDKLTGGTVKGAVQKLLPRGLGYKTKNWIETEEDLKRNLKIINKALNAKTDAETISIIQRDLK